MTKPKARAALTLDWALPAPDALLLQLDHLAATSEPVARCLSALKTGLFVHPDGRSEELRSEALSVEQAALITYLSQLCPLPLSIEAGFGMGSSATLILGARRATGKPFNHVVFDPFGLKEGRGEVVEAYLNAEFSQEFRRIKKQSEIGMGQMLDRFGYASTGLIFIDGGHHYENVMADFILADYLCGPDGIIIFDDASYPAVETVINYVRSNRADYALAHLPARNTSVLQKRTRDRRDWSSFKPFRVPNRSDWTPAQE
jgi:hypothetical protein